MRVSLPILSRIVFLWLLVAVFAGGVSAQNTPDAASGGDPATELRALKDKTVVFVFDVSGSMNDKGNLRRARLSTIDLLRHAIEPGDHVALLTFGAGNRTVFDTTITTHGDIQPLIDQVPTHTEPGAGTNIREPHHQALKLVDAGLPNPGVIVLLTDSFNDEPKPDDATYPGYLKYYTPGGRLTVYPKTPENRDYERLLKKLLASGKLTQMGIGIKIADNGRPIERLPQSATPPSQGSDTADDATAATPLPPAPPQSPVPYIIAGALALVLVAGAVVVMPLMRAVTLRICGGPGGTKDYQIRNGQTVRIGGDGAAVAFDAYSIPAAREPVAVVRAARGQLFLAVVPPKGNQTPPPRVYHNGLTLEREEPLNYGDEVRVALPNDDAGTFREYRLKFQDPKKSF